MTWIDRLFNLVTFQSGTQSTPPRPALNFIGATVTDNPTLGAKDITFTGTGLVVSGSPNDGDIPAWNASGPGAVWSSRTAFAITAFAATAPLAECSQTVASPGFTAAETATPDTLLLTNNADSESKDVHSAPTSFSSSHSFQKTTPNQSVTFTLTGTKTGNPGSSRTCSITWGQKNFWGISTSPANTAAFIQALASSALATTRNENFTVNATGSNKIYFACPTRYGTPTFTVGGFVGGFIQRATGISVTNAQGFTENYDLYESVTAGLGSTTVAVT